MSFAIQTHSLGKCYQVYSHPSHRLLQSLLPRLRALLGKAPRHYFTEYWALRDVSLTIERGQSVGIVGRNGAGKSTFLQLVSGVLAPTTGQVEVSGRVAALLELGSGFNPEFTGRQNIHFNAAILGMSSRQILEKFDEIVDFADIGDYLDMPVNTYSTGMFMRLAFSVAYCVEPEILIVDEALAVGDAKFQAKCYRKIDDLIKRGSTVLLVTHSTEQVVRHCNRAIWIDAGQVRHDGEPKEVTNAYLVDLFGYSEDSRTSDAPALPAKAGGTRGGATPGGYESRTGYNRDEFRYGTGDATITDFELLSLSSGSLETVVLASDRLKLTARVRFRRACDQAIFGIQLRTPDGVLLFADNTRDRGGGARYYAVEAGQVAEVDFHFALPLASGDYFLTLGVSEDVAGKNVPLDRRFDSIQIHVTNGRIVHGIMDIPLEINVSTRPVGT